MNDKREDNLIFEAYGKLDEASWDPRSWFGKKEEPQEDEWASINDQPDRAEPQPAPAVHTTGRKYPYAPADLKGAASTKVYQRLVDPKFHAFYDSKVGAGEARRDITWTFDENAPEDVKNMIGDNHGYKTLKDFFMSLVIDPRNTYRIPWQDSMNQHKNPDALPLLPGWTWRDSDDREAKFKLKQLGFNGTPEEANEVNDFHMGIGQHDFRDKPLLITGALNEIWDAIRYNKIEPVWMRLNVKSEHDSHDPEKLAQKAAWEKKRRIDKLGY
jgi:hypothetical protein